MWGRVKESRGGWEGMEECSNRYSPRHQNERKYGKRYNVQCTLYVMHYRCTIQYCILLHLPMVH